MARDRPFVIGLTGSIAMGKTETARLFAAEGVPVQDADAVIHALYDRGGAAVDTIAAAFPGSVKHGAVDRAALAARVTGDAAALARLEGLVHPLVAAARKDFLAAHRGAPVVLLDIPLLFETDAQDGIDARVVVSAPAPVQRARALARPGMTVEKFEALLARQLPDVDKRARADFVVVTDGGLDHARRQVRAILQAIRERL